MSSLKKDIVTGAFWSMGGQVLSMIVTLCTNIILARLLSPNEFGQVGIIMFFIVIANVFARGGLGGALVRANKPSEDDYSTVFLFNLVVSLVCYLLLVVFASNIADFYDDSTIDNLLIVTGLVLPINAFQISQNTKLVVEMRFKERSLYTFIAIALASVVGLVSALLGVGVWSLVYIQLFNSLFLTLLYWRAVGFEGSRFRFNISSFKKLFGFGANTTLASILNTAFDNIYQLVLGKYFSISQVGLFYQAKKLQDVPGNVINMVTQGVLFSALSKVQDDRATFIHTYNKIVLFFTVCMGLMTITIYLFAEGIILFLYGQKWIEAVFYMKVLSIASFFYLQEMVNRIIFKVFDQTRQFLILEIFKKLIQTITIVLGVIYLNMTILLFGFVLTNAISYLINYYFSRKILGKVSSYEFVLLIKISILSVGIVAIGEYLFSYFDYRGLLTLAFLPVVAIIYFLFLRVLGIFSLNREINLIKNIIRK